MSLAISGTALLLVLIGCATGTADEARLGQARDAATDPDLPRQQATRTAERFFPTPAKPTEAPPPIPAMGELVVTLAVDGGGAPQGSYAAVPADGGTLYAAALLTDLRGEQVVSARWVDATGLTVTTARVEIDRDANRRWVALPLGSVGIAAPGEYAIYLYVGERRLGSLLFQIGPPGSGGVTLPPRPEHPSADRGGPNEAQTQPTVSGQPNGQNPGPPAADPNAPAGAPVPTDPNAVPANPNQGVVPTPGAP